MLPEFFRRSTFQPGALDVKRLVINRELVAVIQQANFDVSGTVSEIVIRAGRQAPDTKGERYKKGVVQKSFHE